MMICTKEKNSVRRGKGGTVLDGVARKHFLEKVMFYFGCPEAEVFGGK